MGWQRTPQNATFVTAFKPEAYGAVGDGIHDDTAAVMAADVAAAGHGSVVFTAGKRYLCLGALSPAHTASTTEPLQSPRRWTSNGGANANGYWNDTVDVSDCAVLDLRYDGTDTLHPAKIDTRGAGYFEIDHLALVSGGSDDLQIMQTTNTTIFVHHNIIIGNQAKIQTACVQNFLRCGGAASIVIGDTAGAPFQGYGSKISDNYYTHIQTGVTFGTYCNSIEVQNETYSGTCGSPSVTGAPYVFAPLAGELCIGNRIIGGTVEMWGYHYAVAMLNDCEYNTFDSLGVFDGTLVVADVYCGASNVKYNNIICGGRTDGGPRVAGPGAPLQNSIAVNSQFQTIVASSSVVANEIQTPNITSNAAVHWTVIPPASGTSMLIQDTDGVIWQQLALNKWVVAGAIDLNGRPGNPNYFTFNPAAGQPAGFFIRNWQIYDGAGINLYFRDVANGVMMMRFEPAPAANGKITLGSVLAPVQAPTATAPNYFMGGVYFDTTLKKLRVGGATGWETITSA